VRVGGAPGLRADSQHRRLAWFGRGRLLRLASVHPNTKAYFRRRRRAPLARTGAWARRR